MPASPTILYLNTDPDSRIPQTTLNGIRRYAGIRGWKAEAFSSAESRREALPALLASRRPVAGCIYECSDDNIAPPSTFRGVPVVYLHAKKVPRGANAARLPTDNAAVAEAAFRELSAEHPSAFAIVGHAGGYEWSKVRERAFSALADKARAVCRIFPRRLAEQPDARAERLRRWIAALPRHTAIFAVNDVVAADVVAAAKASYRSIPRELTLLSVDNLPHICEVSKPTISSIQIDFERAGYVAAKMIGEAIAMKGRASPGMKCLASLEMKGAASAANDTNSSFGGETATLHCAEGASSLPAKRASSFERTYDARSVIGPLLAVRRRSTGGSGRREAFVLEAVEMIRREACDGLTAAALAKRFPCSRNLFDLRFREAVGRSALDEILHIRLEKACTLLAKTDTAISAVPGLCGFRTHTALDRLFRSRFGLSMRDWRKKNA